MKSLARIIIFGLTASSMAFSSPPGSEKDFIAQFREALSSKDSARIDGLTYKEGMSEQDRAMAAKVQKMMIETASEIEDVVLKPLPENFQTTVIVRGRKVEMTSPPAGIIEVRFKNGANGAQATATPYTIVDHTYYLVGSKSSDLGWQGPPDKNIGFMVMGRGQDHAKIRVKWNASGVDQNQVFSEPSSTFWGQHIDSVTVTTDSDDSDLTISILEGGQVIDTSEPLLGKGTLEYKRKN